MEIVSYHSEEIFKVTIKYKSPLRKGYMFTYLTREELNNVLKRINMTEQQIDPMQEAKKSKSFEMYSFVSQAKICFAEYVYDRRKELNISQQELAKRAETAQRIISKIESACYNPSLDLMERIKYCLK